MRTLIATALLASIAAAPALAQTVPAQPEPQLGAGQPDPMGDTAATGAAEAPGATGTQGGPPPEPEAESAGTDTTPSGTGSQSGSAAEPQSATAATDGAAGGTGTQSGVPMRQSETAATDSAAGGIGDGELAAAQQRVVDALTAAGLTGVKIMDSAYLVQATTPENEEVMLVVNSAGELMGPPQAGGPGAAEGAAPSDRGDAVPN